MKKKKKTSRATDVGPSALCGNHLYDSPQGREKKKKKEGRKSKGEKTPIFRTSIYSVCMEGLK